MPSTFQLDKVTVFADRVGKAMADRRRGRGFWTTRIATVGAAGLALVIVTALASLGGDSMPAGQVSIASRSGGAVLAMLAAYLFTRRLRRTNELFDVIITATVALLAILNSLVTISVALIGDGDSATQLIVSVGAGVIVSAGLALAAFIPDRTIADPIASADRLLVTGVVMALAGTLVTAVAVRVVTGEPSTSAIAGANLLAGTIFAVAAMGFARRSAGGQGPAVAWLALAAAVSSLANLSQAITAWTGGGSAMTIAMVTIGGWAALLIAGLRDMEWAQYRRAETAVEAERRRLARDLHDGLAQELAYISAESRRLGAHPSSAHLVRAAERALEESRVAIAALARPSDEPLERLIAETAQSIAARSGVEAIVAVRPGLDAASDVRHALVRILREAMANAIHHGRAGTIRVSLDGPSPLVMAVADDGRGFDRATAGRPDSIGLVSMEERAANVGGRLTIETKLGAGTTVAVVVP